MSDDWQVGDVALCVKGGRWFNADGPNPGGPEIDRVYSVCRIYDGFLGFPDWAGQLWDSACFRKVRPDDPKACDREFETLLNRSKPKVFA